jgi:hypothetical protein
MGFQESYSLRKLLDVKFSVNEVVPLFEGIYRQSDKGRKIERVTEEL